MQKTAFIFPGQGVQVVGMAQEFYDAYPAARAVFETAQEATGLDIRSLCFTENAKLDETEYTQVALLTAELAILEVVQQSGLYADVAAGQSLGEYAALVAAGYLKATDALRLVRERGILMQNAVPLGTGAMVAVIGLTADQVEAFCRKAQGVVTVSNYNSPKQTVVSGERDAVMQVKRMAEEAHARLVTELKVSIPSHSPMMYNAAQQLNGALQYIEVQEGTIPYVANVTAEYVQDPQKVKPLLVQQMYSAVRWEQSVRMMQANGVERFVEIGPGQTLTKLNAKIDRNLISYHVATIEDLERLLQQEKEQKS